MGSLGGECHPSTGWMRCPKDLYRACLLSSALLNCELGFSWSAVWGYEFSCETKKGETTPHTAAYASLKVFSSSVNMRVKWFSFGVSSISQGLLSLFKLPVEGAEKNGWCVCFSHCQRQARSRINSVLFNDCQLPHCQGNGPLRLQDHSNEVLLHRTTRFSRLPAEAEGFLPVWPGSTGFSVR